MTASTSSHNNSILAVHSVDEFVFSVPDLDKARHFYSAFGFDVRDEGGALALYTFGHPHRWARVLAGADTKRREWITLGIHEADEARFRQRLGAHGIATIDAPTHADSSGLWVEGPDGIALQLRVAEKSSPSHPRRANSLLRAPTRAGRRAAARRSRLDRATDRRPAAARRCRTSRLATDGAGLTVGGTEVLHRANGCADKAYIPPARAPGDASAKGRSGCARAGKRGLKDGDVHLVRRRSNDA